MEHNNRPTQVIGRDELRAAHLAPTASLVGKLTAAAHLDEHARRRIHLQAKLLAGAARSDAKHEGFALGLVHRFGLNTPQGIALMQLAEALPRTTDQLSARLLIADKIGSLSWRDAIGDTPKFSQRLALHALDTLSQLFREAHTGSLQGYARTAFEKAIAVLSRQYVLAETLPQALRASRSRLNAGYRFSFDMLGEAAMTERAALSFQQSYLHAVDVLTGHVGEHAISVKLSALHPRFEERQRARCLPLLLERVKAIAIRARAANLPMTLDAEESDRLELTLDVFEHLLAAPELQAWNGLGIAVQAYQRRALSVIEWLSSLAHQHTKQVTLRLVKGAYWDTEIKRAQQLGLSDYPVFVRKCDTDISYLACARRLLEQPTLFYPQFATHNAHTVAAIAEIATQTGNSAYEFQRLHGMGEHLHAALLRTGAKSRIYAPIGPRRDLLPYLVRRLLENGASASFVRQLTDTSIPVDNLVRDPFAIATDEALPHTMNLPTDVRQQVWAAAQGVDLTARDASAMLAKHINEEQALALAAPIVNGKQLDESPSLFITNPAHHEQQVGRVIAATEHQVHLAVTAAHVGYAAWSAQPTKARAAILENAAQLLEKRAPQFIRLAVLEAGKTVDDAIGEVREAVDFCRYYAEQCHLPVMRERMPLGVVACISPWNFPLAIYLGQITAALAAGNTVVAKPAGQTPLIAMLATQLLHETGVPTDALHFVPGDGRIGAALTSHAAIAAVCFTGSVATAKSIASSLAQSGLAALPFIAETGGINAMIVDSSSLPEQVVRDVLTSAFQSAGQRCSALRVLCLQDEIADNVIALLRGALDTLQVGDPKRFDTDVGPLIDLDAQRRVLAYLAARKPIAQAPLDAALANDGWFVAPAIIEVAHVRDVQHEVFGPVLHVTRFAAADLPELVQQINQQGYGLTLGIHSRIRARVQSIVQNAHVGNVYVNRHQVGAVVGQQPFGGHGLSGTGPKAGGPHYLLRLSRRTNELAAPALTILEPSAQSLGHITHLQTLARVAQGRWEHTARRSEMVQFACQLLAANSSQPLGVLAEALHVPGPANLRLPLASIAGESNELRLRPRGVLLCFSTLVTPATLATQIIISVATGNGALVVVTEEHAHALRELLAFLHQSGVPEHLVAYIKLPHAQIPAAWLTTLHIDGIVFDGSAVDKHRIAEHLQRRAGALLPLLSSTDDAYRFCVEQTITVNTAAAGGDPQLLGSGN